jgi:hypothetical protein
MTFELRTSSDVAKAKVQMQLLQPLLQDAVASDAEEDRSLCHPLGAPQVQAVAS